MAAIDSISQLARLWFQSGSSRKRDTLRRQNLHAA